MKNYNDLEEGDRLRCVKDCSFAIKGEIVTVEVIAWGIRIVRGRPLGSYTYRNHFTTAVLDDNVPINSQKEDSIKINEALLE